MARVDRGAMEQVLDDLQEAGVLHTWQRRPLGMYLFVFPDGSTLTPDTKEAAMWVMGASAAMARAVDRQSVSFEEPDGDEIQDALRRCQEKGYLRNWQGLPENRFAIYTEQGSWDLSALQAAYWVRAAEYYDEAPPQDALEEAYHVTFPFLGKVKEGNVREIAGEAADAITTIRQVDDDTHYVRLLDAIDWTGSTADLFTLIVGIGAGTAAARFRSVLLDHWPDDDESDLGEIASDDLGLDFGDEPAS